MATTKLPLVGWLKFFELNWTEVTEQYKAETPHPHHDSLPLRKLLQKSVPSAHTEFGSWRCLEKQTHDCFSDVIIQTWSTLLDQQWNRWKLLTPVRRDAWMRDRPCFCPFSLNAGLSRLSGTDETWLTFLHSVVAPCSHYHSSCFQKDGGTC